MAPEPLHLVGIHKSCPRCGSTDVQYAYNNNNKPLQPRYKCLATNPGCGGRFFTHGGKVRIMRRDLAAGIAAEDSAVCSSPTASGGGSSSSCSRTRKSDSAQLQEIPAERSSTAARARGLRRVPESDQAESPEEDPVPDPVLIEDSSRAPVAGVAGLAGTPHEVGDVDQGNGESRNDGSLAGRAIQEHRDGNSQMAVTEGVPYGRAIQEHGDGNSPMAVMEGVLYGLAPTSSFKRPKLVRIKFNDTVIVVPFGVDD